MVHTGKVVVAVVAVAAIIAGMFLVQNQNTGQLTTEAPQCVARSTIVAHGQHWVDAHVPYSQTGTYEGYRTDCSGFVSMAWELAKPGLTTFTMHTVATNINKDDLQPGDAINCDSEHIVLFAGWTDSGKTHYVAMEETNPNEGTVKRVTPYPYWSNVGCFHPIRYNAVC
jgi:hypothetical protein